ncbi:MAG TPA: peptide-methionine (R)-S-oxide reductase MsrB [Candidatus Binatia bacterium]|jgi:peptide-methionine (R)-S-oxide reductase|nr:peptide-methionine (R)-S-oxide reductase MsrB [Candidatus Binatia bacterium]
MKTSLRHALLAGTAAALVVAGGFRLYLGTARREAARPSAMVTGRSEEEWRRILTPEQYHVIFEQGTELPFSSPLDHETRPGTYVSADCGVPLFRSEQKYDSGTGWPSFWAPVSDDAVALFEDRDPILGTRIEVRDKACGGHLGHVFDDGPPPTGKRYCMNGAALRFIPDEPGAPPPSP